LTASFFQHGPKKHFLERLKADEEFLSLAQQREDNSGSCALVVLVLGDKCYVANTGDSRAVVSTRRGEKAVRITTDHKPSQHDEYARIIQAGGNIVTHSYPVINLHGVRVGENCSRIVPGNLAVSRSFGDRDVKGGNILIVDPEVKSFRLTEDFDFMVIGSDGIFDKVSDRELVEGVWNSFGKKQRVQEKAAEAVEDVMRTAFYKGSQDNVSAILMIFKGMKEVFEGKNEES
jgi:protein phosphatase PTC2/3